MVLPVLLYSCEFWGQYLIGKTDSVDVLKNKIFKLYNDVKKLHQKCLQLYFGSSLKI